MDIDIFICYAYLLLSEQHGEWVLKLLFKDCLTQQEIAERMQCSFTRVNTIFRTSMKELSLGNRPMLFSHGYTYRCENRIIGPWLLSMGKEINSDLFYELPVYELGLGMRNINNLNRGGVYILRELV